jgi:sugar phosphate isomerase/epimerase
MSAARVEGGPRLCYGTNAHPVDDLRSMRAMLQGPAAAVRARVVAGGGSPPGLGLWLPASIARTLSGDEDAAGELRRVLEDESLVIDTVNAFPAGDFHATRVKEDVYRPDWSDPRRLEYTIHVGRVLQRLLAPGTVCTVSTSPGTWKGWRQGPAPRRALARGLVLAADALAAQEEAGGVRVILAPEPEPGCTLESVDDAVEFWNSDLEAELVGPAGERRRRHLGLCLDLCHASVMGVDPASAWRRLRRAGVPVVKVQVSAALEILNPVGDAAAVSALRAFDEPRWLHQVGAMDDLGVHHRAMDLTYVLTNPAEWSRRRPWRVHFHAPLSADSVAGVATTTKAAMDAVRCIVEDGPPWPVLEVETYTWSAIPGAPADLAGSLAGEILAVQAILKERAAPAPR